MFKVAVQVTCMVLLASIFYDILSCNRFHKTQTYKYFKQVGTSKTGKLFLKKLKKAKRRFLKCGVWPSYSTSTNVCETVHQVEPYVPFIYDWPQLKNSTISLIQMIFSVGKNFPSLGCPTFEDLMKLAKAGVVVVSQHIQKCTQTALDYLAKAKV